MRLMATTLPDPIIENPGTPQVGNPQPVGPEISEPPAAPIEVPQPGIERPQVSPQISPQVSPEPR